MTPRVLVGLLCGVFALVVVAAGAMAAEDRSPFAPRATQTQEAKAPPGALERTFGGLLLQIAETQRKMNARLHSHIREIETSDSILPALVVIGVAFLYGVFHAAGPGHGKFIVTSYFLARDAPVSRGVLMSGLIALTQAVSAIVIVTLLVLILDLGRLQVLGYAVTVELVSYALVVGLGLYMAWGALRGKECDHGGHGHDHHHHHHHDHDHGDGHGHSHVAMEASPENLLWYKRLGDMLAMAVAAGIRPCSGAIILLLFTMANGLFLLGIAGTLAMAVGVAITVSMVGLLAIGARRTIIHATHSNATVQTYVLRGVGMLGALFVSTVGALLFLAALQRVPGA